MAKSFNPLTYRNKKQVYEKLPHHQGLCWIWDWSEEKSRYIKREVGLKYYCYKKINGRQYSKTFESLSDAKKWKGSNELFGSDSKFQELTFEAVTRRFFEHNSSRWKITTRELYESYLKHFSFFNSLGMRQINSFAVDQWLKSIKSSEYIKDQHRTRLSYEHELTLLKQIFKFHSEYLDESFVHPCKKRHNSDCIVDHQRYKQAKERAKEKFLPPEACHSFLSILLRLAQKNSGEWLYYHLAEFQLFSGVRIGEACALQWSDMDWEKGAVKISKTVQWARSKKRETLISSSTKTGRVRLVRLPSQLLGSLKSWNQRSGRSSGLVFSDSPFLPIGYRATQYRYNKAFKAMESGFSSTHVMRHSFATLWLTLSNGSVQSLQKQLGHTTPQQSLHYAKITEDLIKEGLLGFEQGLAEVIPMTHPAEQPSKLGEAGSEEWAPQGGFARLRVY